MKYLIQSVFVLLILQLVHAQNIDSIELLRQAVKNDKNGVIAFYTNANVVATSSLFKGLDLNYTILSNETQILDGVKNGKYLAGCVAESIDTGVFNIIKSNILSGHAAFILPDKTTEYPYGAPAEKSRRDFRNAINLAIVNLQSKGIDFDLSQKYNKPIVDVRTCKLNNPDEFPIPNRAEATGVLREILDNKEILVGSFGDADISTEIDETHAEFPFNYAYLGAIINEFSKLSGPDKNPYGPVNIKRVYARSSTANLLRDRIHMTEPYFLIDNVYSGTREKCNSDTDCILANTPSGYETCKSNICVSYARPISEVVKLTCLSYATENLFVTKKVATDTNNQTFIQYKVPGGAIAAIVILVVAVIGLAVFVFLVIWKQRAGKPLF